MTVIMKKENPLVSVIVPSFNHSAYIGKCIESIIKQSYHNIQLIVVDDGSTDNSVSKLEELKKTYNFNLILQKNQGLSKTLTNTIKNIANGKYISICASDDYWDKDKIKEQIEFMEKNQFYKMCYTNCYYVDKNSKIIKNKAHSENEKKFRSGYLFKELFLIDYHIPVTYLFVKQILEEINYYPNEVYCEDYYMNLRISEKYPIGYINKKLVYYRLETNSLLKTCKIYNSQKMIIDLYFDHPLYLKAKKNWKLRAFNAISFYPKGKKYCLPYIADLSLIKYKLYWKSLIKLIIKLA